MDATQLPIAASPLWSRAMPPGPDARVRITAAYAKLVGRDAYFWAWPMVNLFNRRQLFASVKQQQYQGPLMQAPLNLLAMLMDYVSPEERAVACPNQDVVYGMGALALDISPVVVQVPDFGDRFWVYQIVDLRTDGFAQLGKMYGTTPGFYLLAGPDWDAVVPKGITRVFRCPTRSGFVIPRVFQDDTPQDKQAIQAVLPGIGMYPLADFDGRMKLTEWSKLPRLPAPDDGEAETRWVLPEKFVDELAAVLADAPPLPGEESRYAQVLAVLAAAKADPEIKRAMTQGAQAADDELVEPLFQFRNYGQQLPHHWSTISNEARSAPTISPAPRWASRTSSSTHRTKPSTSTRTSTPTALVSTALVVTPLHLPKVPHPGTWLLVAVDLQRASLLRRQRDQAFLGRHQEQGLEVWQRRGTDDLCAERQADRRQTACELATGAKG